MACPHRGLHLCHRWTFRLFYLAHKSLGSQPVLIPLAVAGIIAYLLDPLVAWFQNHGLSRLRRCCVLVVFAAAILLALIIPPIVEQVGSQTKHNNIGENIGKKLMN